MEMNEHVHPLFRDILNNVCLFPSMEVEELDEEYEEPDETKSFNSILSFAVGNKPVLTEYQRCLIARSSGNLDRLAASLLVEWICGEPGIQDLFFTATGKLEIDFSNMVDCVTTAEYLMKIKA